MSTPGQRRSHRQEREGAKEFGGSLTPGSGNGWVRKNDMVFGGYSVEYKTTAAKSYRLVLDELRTTERNALLDGREMALIIDIQGRGYVVLTKDHFRELTDRQ